MIWDQLFCFTSAPCIIGSFYASCYRFQLLIRTLFPKLPTCVINLFGLHLFPPDVSNYFTTIVKNMIKYREENKVTRYDFLDLLIGLKNNTRIEKFKDQNEEEDLNKFLGHVGAKQLNSDIGKLAETLNF